jgi:hypothetical protein
MLTEVEALRVASLQGLQTPLLDELGNICWRQCVLVDVGQSDEIHFPHSAPLDSF